jgi:hypothetical protein
MNGSFAHSFQLVRYSWGVLKQDKKILVFPVIACIAFIIVLASFIAPVVLLEMFGQGDAGIILGIILIFLFYLVSYAIIIFFNTALITCAYIRLSGKEPTLSEGVSNALAHLSSIIAWAVIAATVGLVLQVIAEKTGIIGQIATGLLGAAWSLATFFVIPVFAFEDKGVGQAMKESLALVRKTWGEAVIGTGSVMVVFILLGAACLIPLVAVIITQTGHLLVPVLAVTLPALFIVGALASTMQGIFVAALYSYAKNGEVSAYFDESFIRSAFIPQKPAFRPGSI